MNEIFYISCFRTRERAVLSVKYGKTKVFGSSFDLPNRPFPVFLPLDEATFFNGSFIDFKLGFDQEYGFTAGLQNALNGRQNEQ